MENSALAMMNEEIEELTGEEIEEIEFRRELLKQYQTPPLSMEDRYIEIELTGEEICRVCGEPVYSCECENYIEQREEG